MVWILRKRGVTRDECDSHASHAICSVIRYACFWLTAQNAFFIIAPCRALISAPSGALYVTMHIFLSDFHDTDIGAVSTGWLMGGVERKDVKLGLQKTWALLWRQGLAGVGRRPLPRKRSAMSPPCCCCCCCARCITWCLPGTLALLSFRWIPRSSITPCWVEFIAQNARSVHT